MQRVTSMLPSWDRTKKDSKKGFDKVWGWADKLGAPINKFTNKIGSEAFWPTTLDKESDKAARILRSFCKDGFYAEEAQPTGADGPKQKQRVIKKIPQQVIQNAVGIAIFTTMRTGLWISGAGGSGVVVARLEDGSWSPPSGIMLHTAGLGFLAGIDIYDCVLIINNRKALESFTKVRATVGGEISAVAGPVGVGGVLESDGKWKQMNRPVFTYLKSRGFYAGVQLDGTVIIERTDENERFYNERISATDILAGKVRHVPLETRMLSETLKLAEGRADFDEELMEELEGQPAPGDVDVEPTTLFGIPEPDDPDPFGVLALEQAGLEIREAGSRSRPDSTHFEFKPSPTSPIFPHINRRSIDPNATSNRASYMSNSKRTSLNTVQRISMGTQTDSDDLPNTPATTPSIKSEMTHIKEEKAAQEPEEVDYTQIDLGPYSSLVHRHNSGELNGEGTTITEQNTSQNHNGNRLDNHTGSETDTAYNSEDDLDDDEPVVFEAASATAPRGSFIGPSQVNVVKARGNVVTIPPRPTPPLPPRNSARGSRTFSKRDSDNGASPLASPREDGFEDVNINGNISRALPFHGQHSPSESSRENGIKAEDNTSDTKQAEFSVDEYLNSANQTSPSLEDEGRVPKVDPETLSQSKDSNTDFVPNSQVTSQVIEPDTSSSPKSIREERQASEDSNISTSTEADTLSPKSAPEIPLPTSGSPESIREDIQASEDSSISTSTETNTLSPKSAPEIPLPTSGSPESIRGERQASEDSSISTSTETGILSPKSAPEIPLSTSGSPDDKGDESQSEDFQDAVDTPLDDKDGDLKKIK